MKKITNPRVLSVFSLVMINVIAVDNLRTLPVSAEYGFSLVFYYLLAAVIFFIPSALVSAELATGWPNTGGVYVWVREAFGLRWGFFVIWLQWIYNVVWYPTILAFLAAIIAYLFDPNLAESKTYMLSIVLVLFWVSTIINCFGMKVSSWMSTLGALIGTIIPMLFICGLGGFWIMLKHPLEVTMNWHTFWPNLHNINSLAFFIGLIFGLIGMEMSAVHAEEVKNPQRDYPKALLYSTIIILFSLIFSSLAIAWVVPHEKLSLVSGLIDAFGIFFNAYHISWMIPIIALMIIFGGFSGVSTWIIGPTKGLLAASRDGIIPPFFQKTNKKGAPVRLLLMQAIIVTILSSIFLLMPTVNSSYWVLSVLTSQLALIFYILLFSAAITLRYTRAEVPRAYVVPGGKLGMWLVSGVAILACIVGILVGFLPPPEIKIGSLALFESLLVIGVIIFCSPPLILYQIRKIRKR